MLMAASKWKAVDHGVLSYALGGVFWSLLPHLAPESTDTVGTERQKGLAVLKSRLKEYYKAHKISSKVPMRSFSLRTLKTNKRPKLKAKAGQARRLVDFAASLARKFEGADGEMGLRRHKAMTAFKVVFDLAGQTQLTRKDMVS